MAVPGLGQEKSMRGIAYEQLGELWTDLTYGDTDPDFNALIEALSLPLAGTATSTTMVNAVSDGRAPNMSISAPHSMDEFSGYDNTPSDIVVDPK
tara:strand:- start:980 stop:1264 length:285 start_codon:yes stop_codon:yes gene_type:complete